ncbi:MAG: transposase [Proteobacteria bacterium]|nr:transposase [Pseudomonadota bacterium]
MAIYIQSREELENLVVTMHADGWSIRGLARHFQMGRNRVRRILRENESKRDQGHDILAEKKREPRGSKLDSYRSFIESELKEFPDITGVRLYEKLEDEGFDGGKTIVTDLLRKLRPRPKKEPVVRFETDPGVQGQMDWSPYKIDFTRTGKTDVLCFSYLLGFSRSHFIMLN